MYFPTIATTMIDNAMSGRKSSLKRRAKSDEEDDTSSETNDSNRRTHKTSARKGLVEKGSVRSDGHRPKKKKAKVGEPTSSESSMAMHITGPQSGSAGRQLHTLGTDQEQLGFPSFYNLPFLNSSTATEPFRGMQRQLTSDDQAIAHLLSRIPAGNSASSAGWNPPSYFGGHPMLPTTHASLVASLASLQQPSAQVLPHFPLNFPNAGVPQLFANNSPNEAQDALYRMLLAQRQPQLGLPQDWLGQPSLTSMSIQQLLSSSYPSLSDVNQLLARGSSQLSNERNSLLRQTSLEFADRLGPAAMAQRGRLVEDPRPSIRHYAQALSHLVGADDVSTNRGNHQLQPSSVTGRVEKDLQPSRDSSEAKQEATTADIAVEVPADLPFIIGLSEDKLILNDHQVFLRQQIEVFRASPEDVSTHTRGRTKPIRLGQIGIRCRHCAHLPITVRGRGSIYFPSQLMGIYQVAQNMAKLHYLGGGCTQIPPELLQKFQKARDTVNSGVGRVYWTQAAKKVGLVDTTDSCIRFVRDLQKQEKKLKRSHANSG